MEKTAMLDFDDLKAVLDRITIRLVESSDPGALVEAVVQIAMDTTAAQASSLYLEQSEESDSGPPETIVMVAGAGYELHRVGKANYRKGQGLTGSVWEQSRSFKYDTTEELENRTGPWRGVYNDFIRKKVPDWVCSSVVAVPLRIGTRTIGVIKVENKNPGPPAHFSDRDLLVLELIASTMAVAIETRRLSEKAYSSILNALREVSDMLVSKDIMPFQALCDRIVRKCTEIFNAQACSLYLETPSMDHRDPSQTLTMVAGAGYEIHRIGKAVYRKGQGLTGSIWEESRSVKYDTTDELEHRSGPWKGVHNDAIRQIFPDWVCSSLIGVPLRIGTRTFGVMKVENKNPAPHSHFTHEELRTLEILASNIALALEMLNRHREIFWQGERARGFFHNVSNQFQNALLNIRLSKDHLSQGPERAKIEVVQKRLTIVEQNLTDLEQLRKQLSVETPAGRHRAPIDVKLLVQDLLKRSDRILGEKSIEVVQTLPGTALYANVDRDQVLQALGNILSNAIEALTSKTAARISIRVDHRPATKEVAIAITDNGPGLTSEQKKKFRELGRIPSTKHPGIGAGLPEAMRCCEDSSGYLEVLDGDVEPVGGDFRVVLPTCNPQFLRLAIIDDDDSVIESFKLALKTRNDIQPGYFKSPDGLLPRGAGTGGVVNPELNEYDFILLDCYFEGGLDGIQIYRELSKTESHLAQRILLMSGYEQARGSRGVKVYDKYQEILCCFDEFVESLHGRVGL